MGIINLGFVKEQKESIITQYLKDHEGIKHVIVIYPNKWVPVKVCPPTEITNEIKLPKGSNAEKNASQKDDPYEGYIEDGVLYITYTETIMYRTFYPLLDKIDDTYLIILDECMRETKRSSLTYNCIHKYCNQTSNKLVFQYFPFVKDAQDFMILLDFIDEGKYKSLFRFEGNYKGQEFDYNLLKDIEIEAVNPNISFTKKKVKITSEQKKEYEDKRDELFENLGKKGPDTIPNALELFVNKYKNMDNSKVQYIVRTKKSKADNIHSYSENPVGDSFTLTDLPLEHKRFTDFLYKSGAKDLVFLSTGLTVDDILFDQYKKWFADLEDFYNHVG